uniref:Reverse transcriptase zinc-binding domain-containing protein n=1 Tax=Oryza brachyantha TaxID=4533 RepID=J3MTA8_ORYBR
MRSAAGRGEKEVGGVGAVASASSPLGGMFDHGQSPAMGWHLAPYCHLCDNNAESYKHIFQACTFTQQVWTSVRAWLGLTARWVLPKERKSFDAEVILVTWLIWKEHNALIFKGKESSLVLLPTSIVDEWTTWKTASLFLDDGSSL